MEGPSSDPQVLKLRQRQIRNYLALLLLAVGTPMLAMGDEVCRSQRGTTPIGDGSPWRLSIDTALPSPQDISNWRLAPPVSSSHYLAEARSVVVLFVLLADGAGAG